MKRLLFFAVLLTLFVTRSFWMHEGIPYTHDGENHLARFANYKVALKEGQLPPRFAPNLLNHYGYPVFNYNYPLANIISVPFSVLKFHYELTFKLIIFFALLLGSFGVIRWLSLYSNKKLPILAALIAYLSGPPLISALLFRGTIGEILAYSFWPWLFLSMTAATKTLSMKSLMMYIFLWTAFLLSHNISVFIAAFVFLIYGVWQLLVTKERRRFASQIAIIILSAIGLSFWFWLPAIAEMKEVVVSQAANQREYLLHFPTLKQLLYSPLTFGYSYPGPIDTLSFWLGWTIPLSLLIAVAILVSTIQHKLFSFKASLSSSKSNPLIPLTLLLLIALFLQLEISSAVWQLVSTFRLIQFPWRFALLSTILALPLLVWLLQRNHTLITRGVWLVLIAQLVLVWQARPIDYLAKQKSEYDLHGGTTSTQNENVPFTFRYLLIADWQPSPSVFSGEAEIAKVEYWNGSDRLYRVNVATPTVIVEPTMYFLGWETKVRNVYNSDDYFTTITYTDSDEIQGRIAYQLEPGIYQIRTRFTQNTPARHIGNASFFITGASLLGLFLIRKYRL